MCDESSLRRFPPLGIRLGAPNQIDLFDLLFLYAGGRDVQRLKAMP